MNPPNVQIAAIWRCTIRLKRQPKREIGDEMSTMWEEKTMAIHSGANIPCLQAPTGTDVLGDQNFVPESSEIRA